MASKLYLEDVKGWVIDEQLSIQYLWLARELGCTADEAKRVLAEFAKSRDDVLVHLCICGVDAHGAIEFLILEEEDAADENMSVGFTKVLGKHVYSVSPQRPDGPSKALGLTSDVMSAPLLEQSARLADACSDAGQRFRANASSRLHHPRVGHGPPATDIGIGPLIVPIEHASGAATAGGSSSTLSAKSKPREPSGSKSHPRGKGAGRSAADFFGKASSSTSSSSSSSAAAGAKAAEGTDGTPSSGPRLPRGGILGKKRAKPPSGSAGKTDEAMFDDEEYDSDGSNEAAKPEAAAPGAAPAPKRAAISDDSSDEDEEEDRPIAGGQQARKVADAKAKKTSKGKGAGKGKGGGSTAMEGDGAEEAEGRGAGKGGRRSKPPPKFGRVKVLEGGESSGPAVRRERKEVTYMDENGYLVTREEMVEVPVGAGEGGDGAGDSGEAASSDPGAGSTQTGGKARPLAERKRASGSGKGKSKSSGHPRQPNLSSFFKMG